MKMEYGRIEIDFRYNGGGLTYFAPLFYYGSINKNDSDDHGGRTPVPPGC